MASYKFGNINLSKDQFDQLNQLAMLSQAGVVNPKTSNAQLGNIIMAKSNPFNDALSNFMNPRQQGSQFEQDQNVPIENRIVDLDLNKTDFSDNAMAYKDINNIKIDTNVQDNSLGGNINKIIRPAQQIGEGIRDIGTADQINNDWKTNNPLDYYANNLLAGLGNQGARDYIDSVTTKKINDNFNKTGDFFRDNVAQQERPSTILEGQAALDYINNNDKAGFRVLNNGGYTDLQNRKTGSYGILDDIAGSIISPISNLYEVSGETGNFLGSGGKIDLLNSNIAKDSAKRMNYVPSNMSIDKFEDFQNDALGTYAKTGVGLASTLIPGAGATALGTIGRGVAAGAGVGYGNSSLGNELQDTFTGGLAGGVGSSVLLGAGSLINAGAKKLGVDLAGNKVLNKIDDNIAKEVDNFRAQGLDDELINIKTGLGTGQNNARMNYITENLTGKEQNKALEALANRTLKEGDNTVGNVISKYYDIDPTIKASNNIINKGGNTIDDRSGVDKLTDFFLDSTNKGDASNPFPSINKDADGIAKMSGNSLERFGKNIQMDVQGIKGNVDNLDFFKDERQTRAVFDEISNILGVPKNARGNQVIKDTLVQTRDNLLNNSGYEGINKNNLIDLAYSKLKGIMPTSTMSKDQFSSKLSSVLNDTVGATNDLNLLNKSINGNLNINPNQMQGLASSARDAGSKLIRDGSKSVDVQVNGALDQAVRDVLNKNVSGYKQSNDLYRRLYDTLSDRASSYNDGGRISNLGKDNILKAGSKRLTSAVGGVIENLGEGNLLKPVTNIAGKIGNGLSNVLEKNPQVLTLLDNIANNKAVRGITPRVSSTINDSLNSNQPASMNYEDDAENINFLNPDSTFNNNENDQRSAQLNQLLAQGVLTGSLDVNTAKYLTEALGGGSSKKKELSDYSVSERKVLSQAKTGLNSATDVINTISSDPNLLNESLNPLYFTRSNKSKKLQAAINSAAEMFGRIQSGGAINKDEEARFKSDIMPQPGDDQETKLYKLQNVYNQFSYILGN